MNAVYVLGVSAYYHDSAACLLQDGHVVAAAQEERFTRKKHDAEFPLHAVQYCLTAAGITLDDVAYIVFYDKPLLKFERLLATYLHYAPRGLKSFLRSMPIWAKQKLLLPKMLEREFAKVGNSWGLASAIGKRLFFSEHHLSHAASAYYPSPFAEAAVLTVDGVGEWATTSLAHGQGSSLNMLYEIHFPHSLGLLYSAFTYHAGFKVNSGEYKLMGLAPYGTPRYVDQIYRHLIDVRDDGSFTLNLHYFDYCIGDAMTHRRFDTLFDGPPRIPESPVTQREMDLARSVQVVLEEVMLKMARFAREATGSEHLCLAGGVALNCVANGRLYDAKLFRRMWVQPAAGDAGDAGGALGAALGLWHLHLRQPREIPHHDSMAGALLGPAFSDEEIRGFLDRLGVPYEAIDATALYPTVADLLAEGHVVGWFQGRMEFGPRALGARSILGDPRDPAMQSRMNLKIKFRESFRPFAPAVLREHAPQYFDGIDESPYMLFVASVAAARRAPHCEADEALFGIERLKQSRSDIPAVTHVDYSARLQTVAPQDHPSFYPLLQAFHQKTGCSVLVNTSFNVRGEPIVCTPQDAYRCFMRTDMDYLVLGRYLLRKQQQPRMEQTHEWQQVFTLD